MVRAIVMKLVPKAVLPVMEHNPYLTLRQLPSNQQVSCVARGCARACTEAPP
jgi:hypothetical protein